jgi:hypothetical protein
VKRFRAIHRQDNDAFKLAEDLGWDKNATGTGARCETQPPHARFYQGLASALQMTPATLSCLQQMSQRAATDRFDTAACPWPCQNDQMEEAFADWVHFHGFPPGQWVPDLIPRFCFFKRDGQHGLPADELDCFLKTPEFLAVFSQNLGCRPAP